MKRIGPIVGIAPFRPSNEEQELFANTLFVSTQDIPIVHFIKAAHFQNLLSTQQLFMRRADTYEDDTQEGTYPEANRAGSSHSDAQVEQALPTIKNRDAMFQSQEIARSLAFLHCWYEGDPNAEHMWERYGDQGKGVCIHSTTQALLRAIGEPPPHLHCEVGKCTYWDDMKALPEIISSFPLFRKRRNYDDEQEIRLLARIKLEYTPKDQDGYIVTPDKFQPLPVDIRALIQRITFGSMMSEHVSETLKGALQGVFSGERICIQHKRTKSNRVHATD